VSIADPSHLRTLTRHGEALAIVALTLTIVSGTEATSVTTAQQDFAVWQRTIREATDAARRQLQSDDLKEIAWGAFRAAEYRLDELNPEIASAIEHSPTDHLSIEQSTMLSALFDSAVQLDVAMPAAVLKRFWQAFPVQASVLLARATADREATLLDLASSTNGLRWFAVANALLDAKTPAFAPLLMKNLRFRVLVAVSEDGTRGAGEAAGSSGTIGD
jgi:hypothetical protein